MSIRPGLSMNGGAVQPTPTAVSPTVSPAASGATSMGSWNPAYNTGNPGAGAAGVDYQTSLKFNNNVGSGWNGNYVGPNGQSGSWNTGAGAANYYSPVGAGGSTDPNDFMQNKNYMYNLDLNGALQQANQINYNKMNNGPGAGQPFTQLNLSAYNQGYDDFTQGMLNGDTELMSKGSEEMGGAYINGPGWTDPYKQLNQDPYGGQNNGSKPVLAPTLPQGQASPLYTQYLQQGGPLAHPPAQGLGGGQPQAAPPVQYQPQPTPGQQLGQPGQQPAPAALGAPATNPSGGSGGGQGNDAMMGMLTQLMGLLFGGGRGGSGGGMGGGFGGGMGNAGGFGGGFGGYGGWGNPQMGNPFSYMTGNPFGGGYGMMGGMGGGMGLMSPFMGGSMSGLSGMMGGSGMPQMGGFGGQMGGYGGGMNPMLYGQFY